MIKRTYFILVRKIHGDGNGSYSFFHSVFYRRSWLPQHGKAFECAFDEAKEHMKDKPGNTCEVCAFNKL